MNIKNLMLKMNKKNKYLFDIIMLICLIAIATIVRTLIVGWQLLFPNFEIIMVMTFIAAILLRSTIAFLVPILSMIFSDILLGNPIFIGNQMNKIVLFTYTGFILISLLNIIKKEKLKNTFNKINIKTIGYAGGLGIGLTLMYDIWTNFGWWYLIYPHNTNTLAAVFTAGIPFMIYHMIAGAITFTLIGLPVISYISQGEILKLTKPKNIHKAPVAVLAILLIILSFTGSAIRLPENSEIWLDNSDETSVKISIDGDDWKIEDNIIVMDEVTVFDLLKQTCDKNDLKLEYTYYQEFDSTLIDSIDGKTNGEDGKYWQYYVNNEIIMVGCDQFTVENGDYIEWNFEIVPY